MTFPKAYHGVKKIFTAELLGLIGSLCLLAAIILGILAVTTVAANLSSAFAVTGIGTLVFAIAGAVLMLVGYIMNIVGLNQASKDDDNFRIAFIFTIMALIISVVSFIFRLLNFTGGAADNIAAVFSEIAQIIILVYVVAGVSSLAEKLRRPDMTAMGTRILIMLIAIKCISIISSIIPLFFGLNYSTISTENAMDAIAGICTVVNYVVYLVYLGKAKSMLKRA